MVHTYSVVSKIFASVIANVLNLSNYVFLGHGFITLKTLQTSSIEIKLTIIEFILFTSEKHSCIL